MDLGITTYLFLLINCLLLILGLVRIFVSLCTVIVSVFVFGNLKEVTFSPLISDTMFLGTNEEAMFILGILAGFKNNVRLLYTYQIFIGLLAISKVMTMYQSDTLKEVIHEDMTLFVRDIMSEHKANNLYSKKVDNIQCLFQCCGLDGPSYWLKVSNFTSENLPKSCCENTKVPCKIENAWKDGCSEQVNARFPNVLYNVHFYTLYPVLEVILFLVGILLIVFIKKTASNTLT